MGKVEKSPIRGAAVALISGSSRSFASRLIDSLLELELTLGHVLSFKYSAWMSKCRAPA